MLENFFVFSDELDGSSGFKLFGIEHMLWLFVTILFCIFVCLKYRNLSEDKKIKLEKCFGFFLVLSDILKDIVWTFRGHFTLSELPLYLCGISRYFVLFYAYNRNEIIGDILFSLALPGSISALLFPNWTKYPMFSFFNIHSFVDHVILVTAMCMLLFNKQIKVSFKNLAKSIPVCLAGAAIIYPINKLINTNFLFINGGSPGSPLEFLEKRYGNPLYLLPYFFIVITAMVLNHIVFYKFGSDYKNCSKSK